MIYLFKVENQTSGSDDYEGPKVVADVSTPNSRRVRSVDANPTIADVAEIRTEESD